MTSRRLNGPAPCSAAAIRCTARVRAREDRSGIGAAVLAAAVVLMVGAAGATVLGFESAQMAECEFAGFGGEITAASSALTLGSGFFGCTAFGSAEASVESNGCEFVLHPGTGSKDEFSGTVDISCPSGKKIVVLGGGCEIQIGAQTGLGPVNYKNATALEPDAVEATFAMKAASGFSYTVKIIAGDTETLEPFAFGIE
jgi:hypothetical protein